MTARKVYLEFQYPSSMADTLQTLEPATIAPFENLHYRLLGGSTEVWSVECDLDNLPRRLPPFLRDLKVKPSVYVDLPGYGKLELDADFEDYSVGFYEKLRPVLVAVARVSKPKL